MAPAPGDPILPSQLEQRVQREGQALADRMLVAAGDPAAMREALTDCLDCLGRQFGGATVVALQVLSTTIATLYPGVITPTRHDNNTEETR